MKIITTCALLAALPLLAQPRSEGSDSIRRASARVDELIDAHLSKSGLTAPPAASDEVFVRRAYLDIIGRIPTNREAESFLSSRDLAKRDALVHELLASPGFVSHSFNYWADLLRIKTVLARRTSGEPFIHWMKETLTENTAYDEWVAELLAAEGPGHAPDNGSTGLLLRDRNMPEDSMSNTVRVFLGTRLECAQCHDHPFDKWTQRQYFEMVAFMGDVDYMFRAEDFPEAKHYAAIVERKFEEKGRQTKGAFRKLFESVATGVKGSGTGLAKLPEDYQYDDGKPGDFVSAKTVFGEDPGLDPFIPPTDKRLRRRMRQFMKRDPDATKEIGSRMAFADWLTDEENPRFTTVIANRMWKRVFGVALIEPVDDIKDDTLAELPRLMTLLETLMREVDYDLRSFLEILYSTDAYQRECVVAADGYAYQAPILRRMTAEQCWDSMLALVLPDIDGTLNAPDAIAKEVYEEYEDMLSMNSAEFEEALDEMILRYSDPTAYRAARKAKRDREAANRTPEMRRIVSQLRKARKRGDAAATERIVKQLKELGVAGVRGRERQRVDYIGRASDLPSPAPDGHFLRQFGQSNRNLISSSNDDANVPQLLNLLNGFIEDRLLTQNQAILRREMLRARTPLKQISTAYVAILARKPSPSEQDMWLRQMGANARQGTEDLIWTLLNTHEFLFIQ